MRRRFPLLAAAELACRPERGLEDDMKKISVKLYAGLRKHTDGAGSIEVEVEPGETIEQILKRRSFPTDQVRIIFVNGRAAGLHDSLQGDEQVELFPAIGGG